MGYRFVIHGRLPGNNEFIAANRTNFYVGNKLKKDAQKLVCAEIRQQLRGLHIGGSVFLTYRFYEPNRKRDLDNVFAGASKVIQDALVACEVLVNDSQRYIRGFTTLFDVDSNDPRIEIEITPWDGKVKLLDGE